MRWRNKVHPKSYRCPHILFWDLGYAWDYQIECGPLADSSAIRWYWQRDPDAVRLRSAVGRFVDHCALNLIDGHHLLKSIYRSSPPWSDEDVQMGLPRIDRSPHWLLKVKRFRIVVQTAGGDEGGPGACFPSVAYYVRNPPEARLTLSPSLVQSQWDFTGLAVEG